MNIRTIIGITALFSGIVTGVAAEKTFVSLRNFKDQELRSAGFEVRRPTAIHITALGGGFLPNRFGHSTCADQGNPHVGPPKKVA